MMSTLPHRPRSDIRCAILDLDGTLLPGVLGAQYVRDLLDDGACQDTAGRACADAIGRYVEADTGRAEIMAEAYRFYAEALHGTPREQAQHIAVRTWRTCRERLFPFVHDLLDLLRAHRVRVYLLSGNSDLLIQEAVRDLGLNGGRGAVTEVEDGLLTRRLTCTPGLPGGKSAVMSELVESGEVDPIGNLAIGNAVNDAEIFIGSGAVIAFEPDSALRGLAAAHGWAVADRTTILHTSSLLLSAAPQDR
ncbi:haloacid dehalogenase-like hydrolase [Streptomyces griseoluteus]|uniref:HAD family hydrolase n=1 Tax=Streptomyces griseoluteus TaxID=29306 RepID=UPI0036EF7937